ncbi:Aste57867_23248 [Aphanomyces stellatus]|uniref:Aste57867_23248 protein n=1 Tax=Aphanomyces stellatus TaxID=120398 RepID=A0A485LRU6_9STRA|nr:hypothetical protein As57867_023177 [Aphanomyces stellatus]VFT99893.1 Aste57867_23248 [Aphanomyces stellatus]
MPPPRPMRREASQLDGSTPQGTQYAPMNDVPVLASKPNTGGDYRRSARLGCLQFVDSRQWHYFFMLLLFLDFFGNCIAVSFTSTDNFYQYGPKTRIGSLGCAAVYALDMLLRLLSLGCGFFRNAASVGDLIALLLLLVGLAGRFWKADDPANVQITMGGWTNSYEIAHDYNSNQIEQYIDALYCLFVAVRIILKPRARTFSKKLHKYANHDHLRISMESLRASLRRIPGITAVAVEMMETDLTIICGRSDGDMSRDELMQFLQKALLYRPKELSANAFLAHLRDIDALAPHNVYGAFDVVKSTFWHWSNQSVDLALTTFVVIVFACITPLLAFFLKIVTDQAFPKYVYSTPNFEMSDADFTLHLVGVYVIPKYKNETANENNTAVVLPFVPEHSLYLGIAGLVGISIPFILCDYAMGYFQSKMIAKATQRLQSQLLRLILNKPTQFFQDRTDGDLNNLFQSDISRVNAMWQAVFWNLMQPVVAIVIGFGYLMYFEPIIGIMSFSFAAIIATSGPQGLAGDKSQDFGKKNAYVSAEFQNAIACQKVVRAYEIQRPLLAKFGGSIRSLKIAQFAKDFWSGIVQIYIESAMFIFVSAMTACLAIKVFYGDITAGEFFSSVTMLSRISTPVTVLGGFMRVAIGNASSLQRLDAIVMEKDVEHEKEMKLDTSKPQLPRMTKTLSLNQVNFSYNEDKVNLCDITTVIKQGEYVCVVGPSGCGKSTLLSCLMRFQDISSGAITIDGRDIKQYSKASFMDQVAVVFQDGGILNGTILENIRYGHPRATEQDCIDAANAAECHAFIDQLKDKYHTIIGQHGTTNLSGGQMQRLCLARALVRKPSLLLLDEATSALDPETEAHIIVTLENLARKMRVTIISVTHRLSTTRNADLILVLNDGKVIQSGNYRELMQSPGSFFAEMVHKTDDTQDGDRPSRLSSMHNFVVEDLGNVLDTHRALNDFQRKLSNRTADHGAVASAWLVRKMSVGRQQKPSRRSSQSDLLRAGSSSLGSQGSQGHDRDSYLVL